MIDIERASSLWSMAPLAALGGLVLVPGEGTQGLGGIKKSFTTELHPRALGITLTGPHPRPPAPLAWIFHAHSSRFWAVCGCLTLVPLLLQSHDTCYHEVPQTVPPEETPHSVNPGLALTMQKTFIFHSMYRTFHYE